MSFTRSPGARKIHTRCVEVSTYEHDETHLIVEGSLIDRGFQEYHLETGEKRYPGIIHGMIIRLLVDISTLTIDDVDVEMPTIPRDECAETKVSLDPVKGLTITSGFTLKIKELIGGTKGCAHLTALLSSMAGAAVQGWGVYQLQNPGDAESKRVAMFQAIVNTCRTWREDGPLVKEFRRLHGRAQQ